MRVLLQKDKVKRFIPVGALLLPMNARAQGALEYLLIIGGAILVGAIVISLITATPSAADPTQKAKCLSQKNYGSCQATTGCIAMKQDMATQADASNFFICMAGSATSCTVGTTNIALGRPASQSTTYNPSFPASNAVDGSTLIQHTLNGSGEWWQVDLGSVRTISKFELVKRYDCCFNRPNSYKIEVRSIPTDPWTEVVNQSSSCNSSGCQVNHSITPQPARYVRVVNTAAGGTDNAYLNISEFRVYECT